MWFEQVLGLKSCMIQKLNILDFYLTAFLRESNHKSLDLKN